MDTLLAPHPGVLAFIDDITVTGDATCWEDLWERSMEVLKTLTSAGLMINLQKTKFLTLEADILGLHVVPGEYYLGEKCIAGWAHTKLPRTLLELQTILGKLVWASPFIPQYKKIVGPLEALLSRKSDGNWT
jgi:hypothetical protein